MRKPVLGRNLANLGSTDPQVRDYQTSYVRYEVKVNFICPHTQLMSYLASAYFMH